MNTAEAILPHLERGIRHPDMPVVAPRAFGDRRDIAAATISEAYGQMLQEHRQPHSSPFRDFLSTK